MWFAKKLPGSGDESGVSSEDFYKEILIKPLEDCQKKAHKELKEFEEYEFNAENIKQHRYEEESSPTNERYKELLEMRFEQICLVVEDHLKDGALTEVEYKTKL